METNYVVLVGIFLLLVVGCSGNDTEGNVNGKSGFDQNVGGKVDPVIKEVHSKSTSDSIGVGEAIENGGNQNDGSEKSVDSGASKSGLNQHSGSNEGGNLDKSVKASNEEAKGKMNDVGKVDGSEESVDSGTSESDLNQQSGTNEGDNLDKGGKASSAKAKGKTDGGEVDGGNEIDGSKGDVDGGGASKSDLNQQSGLNEGEKSDKGGKASSAEAEGKTDGGKEGENTHNGQEQSDVKDEGMTDGEQKETPDDRVDPKKENEENGIIQDSVEPPPPPPSLTSNDGFQVEECNSSNMCTDTNKRFAACLRVPGNDSPNLLLVIQNKGKGPLTLKISAPAFVHLDEMDVKITIKKSGTGNLIFLKDGTGECSLDFKDFIAHGSGKSYVNFMSQTPTTALIFAAAILILASRWMCKSFRWRQLPRSGSKYQRLNRELPVSGRARREPDVNEGWDDRWGDNWDDEEAPALPSVPITPGRSSKRLASRRSNK
ncbi:protein RNA-directed DNA methylation 3-like [Gossypium australe]|uniref:Protein RNA-directed DNA methylation 3-like n=1 Tax=Gossypium australe TaxID=47621 RepID=A0A5B6UBX1_9ROSI|nr:protein RNA-directed DNA methylation 3-like [Gossypium australe]